ncbi:MAG: hypothetical protein GY811_08565 [Myxococcales bacterium]|nr:hypothetical protein [Myxococcales bacterium]
MLREGEIRRTRFLLARFSAADLRGWRGLALAAAVAVGVVVSQVGGGTTSSQKAVAKVNSPTDAGLALTAQATVGLAAASAGNARLPGSAPVAKNLPVRPPG